jgi:hypothetical protein
MSSNNERDIFLVWTDSALLLLGSFVLMAVLLLVIVNPPKQKSEEEKQQEGVVAEIAWGPDKTDADIDLWVQAPGDVPVGYSNHQGRIMNLLRDDTGQAYDDGLGNHRYEIAYSRGMPAGEYIINVVSYRVGSVSLYPITVYVRASVKTGNSMIELSRAVVVLTHTGEEQTAIRFTLDERHVLVIGTINHLFRPVWGAHS